MKKRILFIIFMIIILVFLFMNQLAKIKYNKSYIENFKMGYEMSEHEFQWIEEHPKLVLGVDVNNPPFVYYDDSKQAIDGFIIDYMERISKNIGIAIEPMVIASKNLPDALQNDQVDMIIKPRLIENVEKFEHSYPIFRSIGVIYLKEAFQTIEDVGSLKGHLVVVEGSYAEKALQGRFQTKAYLSADNLEDAIEKMQSNQDVFGIAGDEASLNAVLKEKNLLESYVVQSPNLYDKNYTIVVNKSNVTMANIINKGIHNINILYGIEDIQRKWFGISTSLHEENIPERLILIILVIFMAVALLFYFFYISNKNLYKELQERMDQLNDSRNDLEATFDGVVQYMIVINRDYEILSFNRACGLLLDEKRQKILGQTIDHIEVVAGMIKELETEVLKNTFETGLGQRVETNQNGEGYEVQTSPLRDVKGRITRLLIMIKDVTKERATERQLIQDNKMIAIGQLAAGVAHEIRNPLGVIRNYCYVLKTNEDYDQMIEEKSIRMIEQSVEKSGKIIDNLLNFSRMTNNNWEMVNLCHYLNRIIDLERNALVEKNIECYMSCGATRHIYTILESIDMIFINLISNAIYAMPEGGRIKIDSEEKDEKVVIRFSDTGEGIKKENLEKIFNPFFTTKPQRDGNGLGLYIVYNEVQKLNGEIDVQSEIGKGTIFEISLPMKGEIHIGE